METLDARLKSSQGDLAGLLLVLAAGGIIYGWVAAHATVAMGFTDSLDYLLLADFFRGLRSGSASAEAISFFSATRYPPLFPALLGLLGGGTGSQPQAFAIASTLVVVSAISIWFWARIEYSGLAATLIAVAMLCCPAYFLFNLHPLSEPLSIAIVAASFLLAALGTRRPTLILLAALLVSLSPLARAANLALVAAFAVWLLQRKPVDKRDALLPIAIAIAPSLIWAWHRHHLGAESYASAFNPQFMISEMGGWPDALWLQPWRLFLAQIGNWGDPGSAASLVVGMVVVSLGFIGCMKRIRLAKLDAWFTAGSVAMLLLWPYPAEFSRLLLPLYPLMLAYAGEAASDLWFRKTLGPAERSAAPALIALLVGIAVAQGPATARFLHRAVMPVPAELSADKPRREYFTAATDAAALVSAERYARIRALVEATPGVVPAGSCVYAADPRFLRIWRGIDARSYPRGLDSGSASRDLLAACDYFFLSSFGMTAIQMPPLYPADALTGWTKPLLVSTQEINEVPTIVAALLVRDTQPPEPSH